MCPRATSSIESAITSRLTSEVFMPGGAHRDAVRDRDRVELHRRAAGRPDPLLHALGEPAQVEVARHRLGPGVGDADDRPLKCVVVVADALQVRPGGGPLGTVQDHPAVTPGVAAHVWCASNEPVPPCWRSHSASRQRSRRTRPGSTCRPGRCMLALRIRCSSSPVSAIHLASTSSESGSRECEIARVRSGNSTQYSLSRRRVFGHVGHDRLVRVDEVRVCGLAASLDRAGRAGLRRG